MAPHQTGTNHFFFFQQGDLWPHGKPYYDISALLGDAIIGPELGTIVIKAMLGPSSQYFRDLLAKSSKNRSLSKGSAENIAKNLTEASKIQLLMTLPDRDIIFLIDDLVNDQSIKIPSSEVRNSRLCPPRIRSEDTDTSLSVFGVRSNFKRPITLLATSIWNEYNKIGQLDDLSWRCQKRDNVFNANAAMDYIRKYDPREAIRALILPSRPVTIAIADKIQMDIRHDEDDETFINRLLWKFGFNPPRHDQDQERFKESVFNFKNTLQHIGSNINERSREIIRSIGVNLFVSAEHFIEELISYNVWMLSSDHFSETKFIYNSKNAIERTGFVLGDSQSVGPHDFYWNKQGGNTLGTMMVYLSVVSKWMNGLLEADRGVIKRDEEMLPFFASYPDRHFPFRHTELWADSAKDQLNIYVSSFDRVVDHLQKSRVAEIRNGLDHKREEARFPTIEAMIGCCESLQSALNISDDCRLIPKLFWLKDLNIDQYGRAEMVLGDYAGAQISLGGPSLVSGLRTVDSAVPVIIPYGNLLGYPNSQLIFHIEEESLYSEYWKGYPRRQQSSK